MKIGLVLGAGGSVGVAYHGAVLATIESVTGWDARRAHVIVGTSAGSISASMLRAGVPPGDLAAISEGNPLSATGERLAQIGRPSRPRPHPRHLLGFRAIGDPVGVVQALARGRLPVVPALPAGGIPTAAISTGINTLFGGRWPDEPMWLCAVDMRTGERVVFGAPGAPAPPVGSAVAASSAIPSYFAPVSIDGRRYVDGGVRSLVNLDLAVGCGLDLVVVSSPMSHASPMPWPAASTPMRQLLRARLRVEVAAVRRAGVPVVVIEPGRRVSAAMGINPMDARRRGAVSRATREAVGDWLARGVTGRRLADALRAVASPPGPEPESDSAVG